MLAPIRTVGDERFTSKAENASIADCCCEAMLALSVLVGAEPGTVLLVNGSVRRPFELHLMERSWFIGQILLSSSQ